MPTTTMYAVITPARTFSSLVAKFLHDSGINMTMNLTVNPPDYANPYGFFEPMWAINLNDDILAALGTTVYGEIPTIQDVQELIGTMIHRRILSNLQEVERRAIEAGLDTWGMKDGRVCLLAPLWRTPLLRMRARILTIDRSEEAVVESMMDAWPEAFFWEHHARDWYRAARKRVDDMMTVWPYPTHRVDGDALFDDTEREIARLSGFVGRPIDTSHLDPTGRHYTP